MTDTIATALNDWFSSIGITSELAIFLVSLLPILELRGGMIVAALSQVPYPVAFTICFIGNIIPLPFILILIRKVLDAMKKWKITKKLAVHFENKATLNAKKAENKTGWGKIIFVYIFVAIPLPGTGGWTGALVASFMNMKLRYSVPTIFAGVLTAGIIMSIITYWGVISQFFVSLF